MNPKINELTRLPNIGNVLAEELIQAEIDTPEKLKEIGTEQAFIRILSIDETACMSKLQAIEGAIRGIRWHELPKERKEELKQFFRMRKI